MTEEGKRYGVSKRRYLIREESTLGWGLCQALGAPYLPGVLRELQATRFAGKGALMQGRRAGMSARPQSGAQERILSADTGAEPGRGYVVAVDGERGRITIDECGALTESLLEAALTTGVHAHTVETGDGHHFQLGDIQTWCTRCGAGPIDAERHECGVGDG